MSGSGTDTPDYFRLIARLKASGQWDRVWEYSREWVGLDPDNLHAHRAAGQAAIQLDRFTDARPHVEYVLSRQADDDLALRMLSMIQFQEGQHQKADESIRQAIALDPEDPYHWYHLGWMCYRQSALPAARDCLERARELAPEDSDIVNLLAMCEPDSPNKSARKIARYQEALEIDPENADAHNNLGVCYLSGQPDYEAAERCFRAALALDPTMAVARKNLFLTVKQRDRIYRLLHSPRDLLYRVINYFRSARSNNILLYILGIVIWLFAARFAIGILVVWCILFWPLVKIYEFLTLSDIRARAGELGARKGGFLGHRRWPLKLRLGIFAAVLLLFWGGIGYGCWKQPKETETLLGAGIGIAVIVLVINTIASWGRRGHNSLLGRQRAKTVRNLLASEPAKKPWWHFKRDNSS